VKSFKAFTEAVQYIYNIKIRKLQVRENEISLRKFCLLVLLICPVAHHRGYTEYEIIFSNFTTQHCLRTNMLKNVETLL